MKPGDWYTVEQGESIQSIAVATGHLLETIWDAPDNKDLKSSRKDPNILMPGDRVFVPSIETRTFDVPTGQPKAFKVKRTSARLRVQLIEYGDPLANLPFRLEVDGRAQTGTSDGAGWVEARVPPRAREATLTVGEGDQARIWRFALRALDPVTEISGAQARLNNLGYGPVPIDGEMGAETQAALCHFQEEHGLDVSGEVDTATGDKLKELHGS